MVGKSEAYWERQRQQGRRGRVINTRLSLGQARKFGNTLRRVHEKHRGHFLKLFHALRSHPASYVSAKPLRAFKMSKSIPSKAPAGYTKEASGVFNWFKKQWGKVTDLFHKHKGKILEEAKKHASIVGKRALGAVTDYAVSRGAKVAARGRAALDYHVDKYVGKAESAVARAAHRADRFIDKHSRFGVPSKKAGAIVASVLRKVKK